MRELNEIERNSVNGGLYGGQCNANLTGYILASVSVVTVAGPFGFFLVAASWGVAAYQMHDCATNYMMGNC